MELAYGTNGDVEIASEPLRQQTEKRSSHVWKLLAIVGLIGSTALIAYSASNYSNNQSNMTATRIQLATSGQIKFSSLEDREKAVLFQQYMSTYRISYDTTEEESRRFEYFKSNLAVADDRNDNEAKVGGSARHGITKFTASTQDEFKSKLGYKATPDVKLSYKTVTLADYDNKIEEKSSSSVVDWSGILTTSIKDQGYCGSCWAFSAASQIESDAIRAGYLTTDNYLSEQQLVSCDKYSLGCEGGSTESAYYYVYETGGIVSDTDYPYVSYYDKSGTCSTKASNYLVTIDDYYLLDTEPTMKAHVLSTGPLSICLDADTWDSYTGGVISAATCGTEVDHCVQIVGINTEENYWIVRNSWGTEWGVNGFIYVEYGANACAITTDPTYVEVVQL
mmetsp:Transcript_9959/g.8903  ORF Transcript_9959/g.8903 Transcript_9959/m.8903 type:complete len:393 (+) Transcript_9959:59-1237(+)